MPDAAEVDDNTAAHPSEAATASDDQQQPQQQQIAAAEEPSNSKQRSVSFNRDVHVKRIAPNRAAAAAGPGDGVRRQPLVGLSREALAEEAAKVLAQASSVQCSTSAPPERFFSLPTRRRGRPEPHSIDPSATHDRPRRRSEELGVTQPASSLGRSVSDVSRRQNPFALFRKERLQSKTSASVKRSKSDVSDLKSSGGRPSRKRTGSESEDPIASKSPPPPLSPIIEVDRPSFGPDNAKLVGHTGNSKFERIVLEVAPASSRRVNPIEKPPRTAVGEPKPPTRPKRARTSSAAKSPEPPKEHRGSSSHKRLFVDEIDKSVVKQAINALETVAERRTPEEMIHSSQKPPEKPPLTKGQTVDTMVKILNRDKFSPPPKANLLSPTGTAAAHNNNQPFSYTKPVSVSPDPNLYARSASPERPPSPVNRMSHQHNQDSARGVIYAQVVCGENGKQSTSAKPDHRGNHSDEDEGLGYEDTRIRADNRNYSYKNKEDYSYRYMDEVDVTDSPITPRFKEFKNPRFVDDDLMYENHMVSNGLHAHEDDLRGRGDGMDSWRRDSLGDHADTKYDDKFAELSYRRELLENRFNARRKRDQTSPGNVNHRISPEKENVDNNNMLFCSTDKLNRTVKSSEFDDDYVPEPNGNTTLERTEHKSNAKSNTSSLAYESTEIDRREFIDRRLAEEPPESRYIAEMQRHYFPPEPDYEPPSLDSQISTSKYSPETKKYKPKYTRGYMSSQEGLNSKYSNKYKEKFGSAKDHYASNPEISQKQSGTFNERKQAFDPLRSETFHNSLQRQRYSSTDRHFQSHENYLDESGNTRRRAHAGNNSGNEFSKGRYDNDRDRDNKFADSGIENDYRKDSNGDITSRGITSPNSKVASSRRADLRNESEDEGFASSLLITGERQHSGDSQNASRGRSSDAHEYKRSTLRRDEFVHRERSIDDGSFYDPRLDKFDEKSRQTSSKPPKAAKKISSLEKVKQLFSRDSSKKSKKDKERKKEEIGMVREEDLRRRYTEYRGSTENLDAIDSRRIRTPRSSDLEVESKITSRTSQIRDEDSSLMDYDYSQRRRLATPSPSPSPPRRSARSTERNNNEIPKKSSNGWFKSLDRLSKNKSKSYKTENDSIATTEEESLFKSKPYKPSNDRAPTKNLRFFGDTDQESNGSISKQQSILRKREPLTSLNRNGKSLSNSVNALDKKGNLESKYKSSSYNNLHSGIDSRQNLLANSYNKEKYGANNRNLHNISEIHSNSETESQFDERERNGSDYKYQSGTTKSVKKPPMSPLREKRRSRSQGGSKVTKNYNGYNGQGDLSDDIRSDLHTSRNDVRGSRQELSGSRSELRTRRRRVLNGATSPNDSSTEGDSSHQSQRSIVYLHAATVGDIPSTGRISRGRSRDDLSSVNSSQKPHTRTVARSFSVLAPWKPRFYREGYDINYSQNQSTLKRSENNKGNLSQQPTKKDTNFGFSKSKSSSTRNLSSSSKYESSRSSEEKVLHPVKSTSTLPRKLNRSDDSKSSQTTSNGTLLSKSHRSAKLADSKQNLSTLTRSKNDLHRTAQKKSMSTEILSRDSPPPKGTKRSSVERERLSRSISMPKDPNKSAGWFKITKKSKKIEGGGKMY